MKNYGLLLIFTILHFSVNAQSNLPESIKANLVLKPQANPFTSTGFTVEQGATLTILPGTKIIFKPSLAYKGAIITIKGSLVIGAKDANNSKPVVFESSENIIFGPCLLITDAKLDINGLELVNGQTKIDGNTTGFIKNSTFSGVYNAYMYPFAITVPQKGTLTLQNCLIENQGIQLSNPDFPNDLDRLILNKCAFTTKWSASSQKFSKFLIPTTIFAYGTQCDIYTDIQFKAFDWVLKKPVTNEWYIGDERIKKITEDSVKFCKTFSMKCSAKPFTNFKQEEPKIVKDEKKK